jgi:uncharacterized tellurite resistance protein B-like protein
MDIWELHRSESDQTICMVGIIVISVKLCLADGHFSELEKDEILKVLPTHSESEKRSVLKIMELAEEDKQDVIYHAERVKKYVRNQEKDLLEFIIAVLYKLAHSDHVYDEREDDLIRNVADVFELKESLFNKFLNSKQKKYA